MPTLRYAGRAFDCAPGETVLAALIRQGADVPYSCRKGTCLTCLMRAPQGTVPAAAQAGLKDSLALETYFLPCICTPEQDLVLAAPDDAQVFSRATVVALERLAPSIARVILRPAASLYYRAGQFLNLRRADGLVRSYSLASVPRLDPDLEIHVKRLPGGAMSNWVFDDLAPGESLDLQGPNGTCFYVPGREAQSLLLVGNGSGLAPLIGIARDALQAGHRGAIHLYHGSRHPRGLYLQETLTDLAAAHPEFHYHPCVSGLVVPEGHRAGRAEAVAFGDHGDLTGWRVFLCGYPPMVQGARKQAYLAGAAMADIYADPFELRELRQKPRAALTDQVA